MISSVDHNYKEDEASRAEADQKIPPTAKYLLHITITTTKIPEVEVTSRYYESSLRWGHEY